jgi:hypothetical protein
MAAHSKVNPMIELTIKAKLSHRQLQLIVFLLMVLI